MARYGSAPAWSGASARSSRWRAFTALRLPEQVAKFGQSALNMGLSQTDVVEAIIQTAPATGFPPALNALGAISAVFR
jgi:alkylhydroperoxidase/carboxymuconolactone decarboxylase family protein YurZ